MHSILLYEKFIYNNINFNKMDFEINFTFVEIIIGIIIVYLIHRFYRLYNSL